VDDDDTTDDCISKSRPFEDCDVRGVTTEDLAAQLLSLHFYTSLVF
jgi:hypothetical protein